MTQQAQDASGDQDVLTNRSDGEILAEFVERGAETSFAAIVGRHAGMVMGVCRSVLGNTSDAEDATQAVFLTLARRAGALKRRKTVAGWLHRVAWYVAARAREAAAIRRRHEQELAHMRQDATSQEPAIPLEELHAALEELPEKYRLPLLLHHVEGRTEAETAALLGCSVTAASVRLSRGREMLRTRLLMRGIGISLASVAAIGGKASASVPPALIASIARAGVSVAIGKTAVGSASIAALSKGAINMLFWMRVKMVAGTVVLLAMMGGIGAVVVLAAGAGGSGTIREVPGEAATAPTRAAVAYTFVKLGTFGGKTSSATGINALGKVVGWAEVDPTTPEGQPLHKEDRVVTHAFLYSDGKMQDLGTLGGKNSTAEGINNTGLIVGVADVDPTTPGGAPPVPGARPVEHAFLYDKGKMQDLGTFGGPYSLATKINSAGQVVGDSSLDPLGQIGNDDESHAFLYSNGKMKDLGGKSSMAWDINDIGQIVGMSLGRVNDTLSTQHAFIYRDGKMELLNLPVAETAYARGINALGQVIGNTMADSGYQGFLYREGRKQELGALGGKSSAALGINDRGQIVGQAETAADGMHAFLYDQGHMWDLNTVVGDQILAAAGLKTLTQARAINAAGQIVGTGKDKEGNDIAFLLTPMKAPAATVP